MQVPSEEQIRAWRREVEKRYPGFEPMIRFREVEGRIEYLLYFRERQPLPGKQLDARFPVARTWQPVEQFYCEGGQSQLDVLLNLFPTQASLYQKPSSLLDRFPATLLARFLIIGFAYTAGFVGTWFLLNERLRIEIALLGVLIGILFVGLSITLAKNNVEKFAENGSGFRWLLQATSLFSFGVSGALALTPNGASFAFTAIGLGFLGMFSAFDPRREARNWRPLGWIIAVVSFLAALLYFSLFFGI
ncbi:hypothetical protein [Gloeobacter kilaueensis]|uniref:Uncharacterized protein n=1 Tax=Gloeobacter kilaueensis (strain ATCC BAA-2537 / CCAP 1431/1 / ULC 316 / JS1) TaxID=1183438 RepID=U5QDX5_GLOK1|nr:hypothetical protein [Gloeobacter kilaueensis]AGY57073.1 hypothetical protein GKIL_0827 [Gloeobacter kilaueensis JS1]